jgi:hypothetical protein
MEENARTAGEAARTGNIQELYKIKKTRGPWASSLT